MKRLFFAALFLGAVAPASSAYAATLTGTWHVDGSISGNPVVSTCVLAEKEGVVSGTCTGVDGEQAKVTGTVKETVIKFQYNSAYQGTAITLAYEAKFDKDGKLTGTIYVEQYSAGGDFTAKKD